MIKIETKLHSSELSIIRQLVGDILSNKTELSDKWVSRIRIVVDELCSNAIEHGIQDEDGHLIINFYEEDSEIKISVETITKKGCVELNAGKINELLENRKKEIAANGAYMQARGRGLTQIVSAWTDSLEFYDLNNGGIGVRFIKIIEK